MGSYVSDEYITGATVSSASQAATGKRITLFSPLSRDILQLRVLVLEDMTTPSN